MRLWLATLMLALLPLQFSWAAAAAYCGHETGDQAQHFGHHEHQHAGQFAADTDNAPAGFDFDCGHCHGVGVGLLADGASAVLSSLASRLLAPGEGTVRTLAQSPPERPQWLPLA